MPRRVIVVGAGVGGLTAAAELAASGVAVTLLEANSTAGGKLRQVRVGAHKLDAGPTVFTMRWVFDELFSRLGESFSARLPLVASTTLARHAWSEHERLDLFADVQRSADAVGRLCGADEARRYLSFCARARGIYQALEHPFLRATRPGPLSLAWRSGWRGLPGLARISPFRTMWHALESEFQDPRLRQLFGRYATYCGSSPFSAPATLMLVAHVEQDGVWRVEGGMHCLAQALAGLAERQGALLRYSQPVAQVLVRGGRACGVRLASGEELPADAVVFNGDPAALSQGLLGEQARAADRPTAQRERSLSALTWNRVVRTRGFALLRHNVFFSPDYRAEFDQLQHGLRIPSSPTVYVCAQDRGDDDAPQEAGERLLVLVNAPATGAAATRGPGVAQVCEQAALAQLERCGLQLEPLPDADVVTTPADFERLFPGTGGALYGRASHGWRASFQRPGARSAIDGLYLAGGATHPGPGVPMAALSGGLAAQAVLADFTRRRTT
jgi:1-hydroxycarotenoid 3,4-desaturase